jgi:hypothetical protein
MAGFFVSGAVNSDFIKTGTYLTRQITRKKERKYSNDLLISVFLLFPLSNVFRPNKY